MTDRLDPSPSQTVGGRVESKEHKPNCDLVTGRGMGLSENIIVAPRCTCHLSASPRTEQEPSQKE